MFGLWACAAAFAHLQHQQFPPSQLLAQNLRFNQQGFRTRRRHDGTTTRLAAPNKPEQVV